MVVKADAQDVHSTWPEGEVRRSGQARGDEMENCDWQRLHGRCGGRVVVCDPVFDRTAFVWLEVDLHKAVCSVQQLACSNAGSTAGL